MCVYNALIVVIWHTERLLSDDDDLDDEDSDEEFHYPGSSPAETLRPASMHSSSTDYFSRGSSSRGPTDLTPHLSQAPEFRVPTHEAPQKVLSPRWTPPTPHQLHAQWERDEVVSQCRSCIRRFTFLLRRVCSHCLILPLVPNQFLSIARKDRRISDIQFRLTLSLALPPLWPDILRSLLVIPGIARPIRCCARPG